MNLGIRFEHETPATERYDRAVNGFNPVQFNPITTAGAAAYATLYNSNAYTAAQKTYLPTPSQFNTAGGLNFANPNNRQIYNTIWGFFSPRVGAAWTPAKLGNKTVIRAGFGIFVFPIELFDNSNTGATVNLSNLYRVNQAGFSQTTQYNNNNLTTPVTTLSNPFPGGIVPQGSGVGPGAFIGQGITFFNPMVTNPYGFRWDFSIQHELPGQIVLELAYIGSHSVRLPIAQQLDPIPRAFLDPSTTVRNNALNTLMTTTVPNPFAGLVSTSAGTAPRSPYRMPRARPSEWLPPDPHRAPVENASATFSVSAIPPSRQSDPAVSRAPPATALACDPLYLVADQEPGSIRALEVELYVVEVELDIR